MVNILLKVLGFLLLNSPVGYDLLMQDWVQPYGKGLTNDMIFTVYSKKFGERDAMSSLEVAFPNKYDGIKVFYTSKKDAGRLNILKSPHCAPLTGYTNQLIYVKRMSPHKSLKQNIYPMANRHYFIRVRSSVDQNGNLESALYGKIYHDLTCSFGVSQINVMFEYYLNPTPNDRNIEYAPGNNLFKFQGRRYTEIPRFQP